MPLPINVVAFERFVARQRNQDRRPTLDQLVKPRSEPVMQITIMADCERRYLWINEKGDDRLGGEGSFGWDGVPQVSKFLQKRLTWWQDDFERAYRRMMQKSLDELQLDWGTFNRKGIWLAWELKGELGKKARVFYEKPCEDPTHWHLERREIMDDGMFEEREIVSRPGPKHCVLALRLA